MSFFTTLNGTPVHVNQPDTTSKFVQRVMCPDCKKVSTHVVFCFEWYGPDRTCLRCGRRWSDGEWMPLQFYRYARRGNWGRQAGLEINTSEDKMTAPIKHQGNIRLGGVYGNPSPGFVPMVSIVDPVAFVVGKMSIRGNVIEIAEMSRAGKIWVWKLCYINAFDDTGKRYATPSEAEGAV